MQGIDRRHKNNEEKIFKRTNGRSIRNMCFDGMPESAGSVCGQRCLPCKSSLEGEVENIVAEEPDENTAGMDGAKQDGSCDALVGTEENGIWICAEVPAVPQTVPALTLREQDGGLRKSWKELLDSKDANVQDITAEYLAQMEKELSEMKEDDKPVEWLDFGDDSFMMLSDGQKMASFRGNTSVSYVDEILKKSCDAIYKKPRKWMLPEMMRVFPRNFLCPV